MVFSSLPPGGETSVLCFFSNLTQSCQPNCPTSSIVPSFPRLPAYGCFLSTLYGKIETGTSGNTLRDWRCTFTQLLVLSHREVSGKGDCSIHWAVLTSGKWSCCEKSEIPPFPFQCNHFQFCAHLGYYNFLTGIWTSQREAMLFISLLN